MADKKTEQKTWFEVQVDGWMAGRRVRKGDLVEMTAAQAKYENVKPASARKVSAAKSEPAKESDKS